MWLYAHHLGPAGPSVPAAEAPGRQGGQDPPGAGDPLPGGGAEAGGVSWASAPTAGPRGRAARPRSHPRGALGPSGGRGWTYWTLTSGSLSWCPSTPSTPGPGLTGRRLPIPSWSGSRPWASSASRKPQPDRRHTPVHRPFPLSGVESQGPPPLRVGTISPAGGLGGLHRLKGILAHRDEKRGAPATRPLPGPGPSRRPGPKAPPGEGQGGKPRPRPGPRGGGPGPPNGRG